VNYVTLSFDSVNNFKAFRASEREEAVYEKMYLSFRLKIRG